MKVIPSNKSPRSNKPAPFKRPFVEISAAGREWQWVLPEQLKTNDIVPDLGLVKEVIKEQDPTSILIKGPELRKRCHPEVEIWAFTRKPT